MNFKDIVNEEYLGNRRDITIISPPKEMDDYILTMHKIKDIYGGKCPHCGSDDTSCIFFNKTDYEDGWKFWKPLVFYLVGNFKCKKCKMEWKSPWMKYERFKEC